MKSKYLFLSIIIVSQEITSRLRQEPDIPAYTFISACETLSGGSK